MTDVAFVAVGWIGSAVAVAAYTASVILRTRRAGRARMQAVRGRSR